MENGEIVKKFEQLWSLRKTVEQTWDVIDRFIMPYRGRFFKEVQSEHAVEWRQRDIFDSTAVMAAQNLASTLHGSLTSPAIKWFDLRFRDNDMNADQAAKEWLEECSNRVFDELQDSNFNLEVNELYLDLVGPGTAVIVEESVADDLAVWKGVDFTAVPIKECYFEQDHKSQVWRFFRRLNWSPSQIISKFGKEKCPQCVLDKYEQNPDERMDLIFCVYPIEANKDADISKPLAPERRPFGFKYVLRAGAEQLGETGGYFEMPAFVPRWRKTSESMWGNSPAMVALADVLTLNQTIDMRIRSIEKLLDPPQKTTERNLIGDLELQARGLTIMRDINNLQPLDTGANINAGEIEINDLRQAIRNYFFTDQLELKESPAMTATEVQVRYELMQRLLGPTLGRLQSDFLDPLIQRTFNLLFRAGQLPDVPDVLATADAQMDIEYQGPMARAQKSDQAASVERWTMGLASIAEFFPEVLDVPDPEAIARETGHLLGVPATMMRDSAEVALVQKQRKADQAKAQQLELEAMEGAATEQQGKGQQAMKEAAQ